MPVVRLIDRGKQTLPRQGGGGTVRSRKAPRMLLTFRIRPTAGPRAIPAAHTVSPRRWCTVATHRLWAAFLAARGQSPSMSECPTKTRSFRLMRAPGTSSPGGRGWVLHSLLVGCIAALPASAGAAGPEGTAFLAGTSARSAWLQTIDTVASDWPVIDLVPPDPDHDPPRPGVVRSAWMEAVSSGAEARPQRQRVVARVRPAADGAWIDAFVETESIGQRAPPFTDSLLVDRVDWTGGATGETTGIATDLVTRLAAHDVELAPLPALPDAESLAPKPLGPPWAGSRFPRVSRAWHKLLSDEQNFYECESLVCITAAFGAGALMANTGFDTTVQEAWQRSVAPTDVGKFFSGCKDIGEGRYALAAFGAAGAAGLLFEGRPTGDILGEWGSRSLRIFVVGAPPVYLLQLATGASRPGEGSAGSQWHFYNDNNGVSGHAFVGAIPFLAAADMVESPWAKGGLYVCSTFVAFSRINDNAHYPSQAFLGWYLAWASAVAVDRTEWRYAGMDVRVVPLPIADMGGMAVEARW